MGNSHAEDEARELSRTLKGEVINGSSSDGGAGGYMIIFTF